MNVVDPPFDPPYVTTMQTPEGIRRLETLADGTTRPVSRPAVDIAHVSASQWSASGRASGQGADVKTALGTGNGDRVFLSVPFAEKDAAKSMGARWDAARKKWYVPHGLDVTLFARWSVGTKL